jgi:hypothetical protein
MWAEMLRIRRFGSLTPSYLIQFMSVQGRSPWLRAATHMLTVV